MPKYRKKPVEVEMCQFVSDDPLAALDLLVAWADDLCERNENVRLLVIRPGAGPDPALRFYVQKGRSECTIGPGDWIAAEADGDGYYPLTRDAQAAGYEELDEVLPEEYDNADERAYALIAGLMQVDGRIVMADADWLCGWIQRQRV